MIPEFEYAPYVWTSYGIFAIIVAWQVIQPLMKRRRLKAELREEQALEQGDYVNDTQT
ncbi:MAG: heme exporter protein CcmD [Wenzhouxiangella sp.]|jgi:heme exporter protein CcmD|nr:heme exporter protein CcmD [Wenzhouxiangella sp.]